MTIFLTAFAVSLAWAIYAALATERRHRAAWSDVEQPAIDVGDASCRRAAVRPRLDRAPGLVRLTAFACLWIGQAVMVVMFVAAVRVGATGMFRHLQFKARPRRIETPNR